LCGLWRQLWGSMHPMKNSRKRFLFEGDEKKREKIETPHVVSVLRLWTIQKEEVVRLLLRSPCLFGMCGEMFRVLSSFSKFDLWDFIWGFGFFLWPFFIQAGRIFFFDYNFVFYASLKLGFDGCYFFRLSN
jgi:hypothetical protein